MPTPDNLKLNFKVELSAVFPSSQMIALYSGSWESLGSPSIPIANFWGEWFCFPKWGEWPLPDSAYPSQHGHALEALLGETFEDFRNSRGERCPPGMTICWGQRKVVNLPCKTWTKYELSLCPHPKPICKHGNPRPGRDLCKAPSWVSLRRINLKRSEFQRWSLLHSVPELT